MNRLWISSLSLAGVVGSGGAAWASLSEPGDVAPPPADVAGTTVAPVVTAANAPSSAPTTISYQVGTAGTVTVDLAANGATVTAVSPGVGWTVGSASAAGAHLEVVFTDPVQVVTFSADLIGGALVPSVSAVAQPGEPAPAPMAVTEIGGATTTAPRAATPPTAPAPTQPVAPVAPPMATAAPAAPAPAATTAPSGGGESDEHDDDEHDDEYGDDEHDEYDDDGHDDDGGHEDGDDEGGDDD
jgi:hypothetical protein